MIPIVTHDNCFSQVIKETEALEDLRWIADKNISSLRDAGNNDLWIFPRKGDRYDDKIESQKILSIVGDTITTGNMMGFIGYGNTELTIRSRFTKDSPEDWFMQYLLQRVFSINLFDLKHARGDEEALNITALLFPYFLQKALSQGVYREYRRQEYNDSHLRGSIDISRHIKQNFPFKNGTIAYSTREFKYDNPITQLVRHTIEFLKGRKGEMSSVVLYSSPDTQANIKQIIDATPSYQKNDRAKIISANLRPKIHPYYSEYRPLQRLCLQILRGERISYGKSSDQIWGVLFDGAWLWEEYLNITMKKIGFTHPQNKVGAGGIQVYSHKRGVLRYPDYMHPKLIADAKYKRLYREAAEEAPLGIPRDDLNQMITYLHITQKSIGIFICPRDEFEYPTEEGQPVPDDQWNLMYHRVGVLNGHGGEIHVISVTIPQNCLNFKSFYARMESIEASLEWKLNRVISGEDEEKEYTYA